MIEIRKKVIDDFSLFYKKILNNKCYYLSLLFFVTCAYGFNLFNRSVSMDDMAFSVFGEGKVCISIMRWGIYLIAPFINTMEYSPFINRFFALIFFIIDAILFSFLIYLLNEKKDDVMQYVILSSLFLTYPLINEIWEFSSMSVNLSYNGISFYFLFVFTALILLLYESSYNVASLLLAGLILSPAMAGYESVIFAYITLVFVVLYYKSVKGDYKKFEWFFDGLRYALPLIIALVIRVLVGNILIFLFNVPSNSSLGRSYWQVNGFKNTLIQLLYNGWYYIIRGLSYFPIGEFVVASIIYLIVCLYDSRKNKLVLILGFGLFASIFFLSIIQGDYLYYRTAQTVQVFIAFVGSLLFERTREMKNLGFIATILLLFVCLRQSVNLHEILALNNQRSDNEAFIARQIGYRIYSEFDKYKTVVFCGEYQLGDFIESQITLKEGSMAERTEKWIREKLDQDSGRYYQEYISNNVNSYFNKQMDAFNGQIMIKKYMSYYGFDINVLENLSDVEEDKLKGYYENIAKKESMKPLDIKDMGDYILVYLGPTIDGYHHLKY